nr:hypothetical protein [Tanacetum cinerariifolium]
MPTQHRLTAALSSNLLNTSLSINHKTSFPLIVGRQESGNCWAWKHRVKSCHQTRGHDQKQLRVKGTNSTNFSSTKDAANQEVKKDVSSLRYIALPNWAHDTLLETSSSKPHDESSTKVPEGSGNPNLTVSSSNPPADQIETLTVESPIPTDSSPVPTACLNDSPEPSSEARLISKRVANQEETPSWKTFYH